MSQDNKQPVNTTQPELSGELQGLRNPDGTIKKGMSLNPKGKPKGLKNLTTKVKEALLKLSNVEGKTFEDLLVDRILVESIQNGNNKILNHLWDHIDGRPMQKIDMTSDGAPLQGVVVLPPKIPKVVVATKKKKAKVERTIKKNNEVDKS